jgi:hypothetical protein
MVLALTWRVSKCYQNSTSNEMVNGIWKEASYINLDVFQWMVVLIWMFLVDGKIYTEYILHLKLVMSSYRVL